MPRSKAPAFLKASSRTAASVKPKTEDRYPIIGDVGKFLSKRREADPRDKKSIHVSEISKAGWCPRSTYYDMGKPPEPEDISDNLQRIFEEGHNIHGKWQTWLWGIGVLEGIFECLSCRWKKWAKSPMTCPGCGAKAYDRWDGPWLMRYREVPLASPEHGLIGHADGKVTHDDYDGLVEVKSIGMGTVRVESPQLYRRFLNEEWPETKLWSNINRPFPSHIRQGITYCYCYGADRIYFVYDWKPHSAVKVFTVDFDLDLIEERLDGCKDVLYHLDKGSPPPRPRWAEDPDVKGCKVCPNRSTCWGIEEEQDEETTVPYVIRRRRT